jgi:hypothetical protein
MYCKEPGDRKLKDRRVNPRSASPSFSPGQKLSPFSLSPKKTKKNKKLLLAPRLRSTLSLSRVVSPFFLRSEKKRLASCGIIQIAVCAKSFSAREEYFFIVVFFVHRKKKKKKQCAAAAARRRGYVAANFFYLQICDPTLQISVESFFYVGAWGLLHRSLLKFLSAGK